MRALRLFCLGLLLPACSTAVGEVTITQRIEPGRPFFATDGSSYNPRGGERFLVNAGHRIPAAMVVQGDTVVLRVAGLEASEAAAPRWRLRRVAGRPRLRVGGDPLTARFLADGYGENRVEFSATVGGRRIVREAVIQVEFSSANMLASGETVAMPDRSERGLVRPTAMRIRDHREQVTARNPATGRLVTLWQVKFGGGDGCPMGVATTTSDDHGLTWERKQYLYLRHPDNSGWGSIGWNPGGNDGRGELLLWASSHVRSPDNRLMLFRSRDNAETWQRVGDYQEPIAELFGCDNAERIYFGVNRTIATLRGTLLAPMVVRGLGARVVRSEDNGRSWQAAEMGESLPRGNEDALVETIDGGKVILMARPGSGSHNRRYESRDDGRTWTAAPDTVLPTARANFGLDKVVEPGAAEHGWLAYSCAAARKGPHKGRQRLVVALNRDPKEADESRWDVRLLWDAPCSYSDILYVPEDKSLLVTVETINPGASDHGYAAIRCFKMSLRYWRTLPPYKAT